MPGTGEYLKSVGMRTLLYTIFLLAGASLGAQYDKGNWYLSAASGVRTVSSRPGIGDHLGSSSTGGFFLENNLLVGTRLELGSLLEDNLTDIHYRIEPFARYYIPTQRMRRLRYFAEVGAGLLFEDNLQTYLRGGVGAEYRLAPGLMATAGLRYNTSGRDRPAALTLDFGINLVFGDLEGTERNMNGNRKGTFMLDANLGQLSVGKLGDIGILSGALSLNGGYFLTNRLLLEGGVSFSANNIMRTADNDLESRNLRFTANLGLRYLFNEGRRFQPYLAAGLRYEHVNQYYEYAAADRIIDFSSSGVSASLKAGFLHHFNERVALDVHLGYNPVLGGTGGTSPITGGVGLKVFLGKR